MTTQSCKKFYFVNSADCFAIEQQPLDFVFPGFLAGIVMVLLVQVASKNRHLHESFA